MRTKRRALCILTCLALLCVVFPGITPVMAGSSPAATWAVGDTGTVTANLNAAAYGEGLYVAVGDTGTILTAAGPTLWTDQTSALETSNLYGVAYGEDPEGDPLYVAVGGGGKILTSDDGANWSDQSIAALTDDFRAVAYGGGSFIAVGDSGAMAISNNGTYWRSITSAAITSDLTGVTYGMNVNGLSYFTAVGGSNIWCSGDTENWFNVTSGSTSLTGLTYGKDGAGDPLFFTSSSVAGSSESSDSGYSGWGAVGAAPAMTAVAYGSDTFIGVNGDPEIWFSTDGAAWNEEAAPGTTESLNGAAYGGDYFFAVGNNGTVVYLPSSTAAGTASLTSVSDIADNEDGRDLRVTFARAADESQIGEYRILIQNDDDGYDLDLKKANAVAAGNYVSLDPTAYPTGPVTVTLTAATLDTDGSAIDGGLDYTSQHYRVYILSVGNAAGVENALSAPEDVTLRNTEDGWKWANGKPQGNTLNGVIYGGGRYVAVGDSGTLVTSTNGTSWTSYSVDTDGADLYSIVYGRGKYVAVGDSGWFVSTDAENWSYTGTINDIYDVAYGEGLFVSVALSGEIYTSTDGTTWLERTDIAHQMQCVDYIDGQFIAGALNGWILTSPDGVTWTEQTSDNINIGLYSMARADASGSTYVAVGLDNGGDYTIMTSADAQTWNSLTSFTNTDGFLDVIYAGGRYVAVGNSGIVYTSTDGTTWTSRTSGTDTILYGIGYGNGRYVAVGGAGQILTSSDAVSWTTRSSDVTEYYLYGMTFANGLFTAVGDITIMVSENGKSWREASAPPVISYAENGWSLSSVTSGEDTGGATLYAAVGCFWDGSYDSWPLVATSEDGENWDWTIDLPTSYILNGVAYGADIFVAVGNNGTILYAESDALNLWSPAISGTTNTLNGVFYDSVHSRFVAVGGGGTILYSTDGASWTVPTTGTTGLNTLYGITGGDGTLMAIGDQENYISSDGGTNWTLKYDNTTTTLYAGAYYNNTFVGVGNMGRIYGFDDTAIWGAIRQDNYITDKVLYAAAYGNGVFTAIGENGAIIYSGTAANTAPDALSPVPTQSAIATGTTTFEAADIAEDLDGDTITITSIDTSDSDAAVATAVLSGGVVTVTGVGAGTTEMIATVSDGTDTAIITVTLEITSGGGGGGGGDSNSGTTTDTDYGSLTENGSSLTAKIDSGKLDLGTKGSAVDVSVEGDGASIITFEFTVADLKEIADNGSTLRLKTPFGIYHMPLDDFDFDSVSDYYSGIDFAKITVTVTISKNSGEDALLDGAEIIGQPIDISFTLVASNRKMVINQFIGSVERDLLLEDGEEFTSGVEIGEDGTIRHVPARVITIDGKTYVAIYSRTNGINCLINKKAGFNDMTGHWAQETVNDMVSRLIISGAGNSTFLPDEEITRAEFIAIVIRALGLKAADSVTIADVDPGKWYYDVIAAAYSNGLVSGDTNGLFRPEDSITRQEAMAIVCRAMALADLDTAITDGEVTTALSAFYDTDKLESWAKNSAAVVIKNGIISGSNGALRPTARISRAETAVMIRQLLAKAELI